MHLAAAPGAMEQAGQRAQAAFFAGAFPLQAFASPSGVFKGSAADNRRVYAFKGRPLAFVFERPARPFPLAPHSIAIGEGGDFASRKAAGDLEQPPALHRKPECLPRSGGGFPVRNLEAFPAVAFNIAAGRLAEGLTRHSLGLARGFNFFERPFAPLRQNIDERSHFKAFGAYAADSAVDGDKPGAVPAECFHSCPDLNMIAPPARQIPVRYNNDNTNKSSVYAGLAGCRYPFPPLRHTLLREKLTRKRARVTLTTTHFVR
ncbi:MAG: hypothetical protein LBU32_10150 [Clostridiales bacterium]|nr:hypothetical protein [Clostridiales bacterium]